MKKICIFLLIFLISGCSNNLKEGYSSNLLNKKDREEIKSIFESSNISNVNLFFSYLDNYNNSDDLGCGLKDWDKTSSFKYDDFKCIERFEKENDISDGNCRITSFMLTMNDININKTYKYDGTYLMLDDDVLKNNDNYKMILDKYDYFTTLFGEMKIDTNDLESIYPKKWKDYGISNSNKKVSLISLVMHDSYFNELFVGHAGVLIDLDDKYLFVEKIAFEEPYQFNVLSKKEDLIELFKSRDTYFGDGSESGPFIYENDKLMHSY